jgi:nucleoside 2-deoxyribosyltransferase
LNKAETQQTVHFNYAHALSVPLISPPIQTLATITPLDIDAECVLRFGMVEGNAVVNGRRVVYDPQSAYTPELFGANGSKADVLAVVCNALEARLLTGETDLRKAGESLLTRENAHVVVLKCGCRGALVIQNTQCTSVPAFRTERVWPLGSGDVFASLFAHYWAVEQHDPVDAARLASKGTAYYCSTRALPIPADADIDARLDISAVCFGLGPQHKMPLVYLAAPFFNMMERWMVEEARDAIRDQGLRVFSPLHDVGLGGADEVAPKDVAAIHQSDSMFAVVDHLDAGTLFEIGYARALSKPVVVFGQNVDEESLKMLKGTECDICDDFVTAIYRTAWATGN